MLFSYRKHRSGTIAMELLWNLPLWLITLLALIELGLVLSSAQYVSFGARLAAEEASRTEFLAGAEEMPPGLVEIVRQQLGMNGMAPSKIVLEHNVGGKRRVLTWGDGPVLVPKIPPPTQGPYVRVTVAARLEQFVPRLFRSLGLDLAWQRLVDSVTYPFALQPVGN